MRIRSIESASFRSAATGEDFSRFYSLEIELSILRRTISLNSSKFDNLKFSWTDRISESRMIYLEFENIISGLDIEQAFLNTLLTAGIKSQRKF